MDELKRRLDRMRPFSERTSKRFGRHDRHACCNRHRERPGRNHGATFARPSNPRSLRLSRDRARLARQSDASSLSAPVHALAYQPMLEVMQYLRANGFTSYIVTGGGQAFVRAYEEHVYGTPPEHVVGSSLETILQASPRASTSFWGEPSSRRSETARAISKCSNTSRPRAARASWLSFYMTTPSASIRAVPKPDRPTRSSERLPLRCTTTPFSMVDRRQH